MNAKSCQLRAGEHLQSKPACNFPSVCQLRGMDLDSLRVAEIPIRGKLIQHADRILPGQRIVVAHTEDRIV